MAAAPEGGPDAPVRSLRRALLGRGLMAAGALALGPRFLESLATGAAIDDATLVHAPARVTAPPIISRQEWGADESLRTGTRSFAPVTKAIVHHTATLTEEPDPGARVRAIYRYHVQGSGWSDIGYNFLIDQSGLIYEGRWARDYGSDETHGGEDEDGLGVLGAHAYGFNRGSVGVALLGTYTSADATATDAALEALTALLSWKLGTRGIDPHGSSGYAKADGSIVRFPNLCGHRDVLTTGCPGDGLGRRLAEVRTAVAATIASPPVEPRSVEPSAGQEQGRAADDPENEPKKRNRKRRRDQDD